MSHRCTPKTVWIAVLLAGVGLLAFAACGGGEEEEANGKTHESAATETSEEQTPTEPGEGSPTGPRFSGSATATVTIGGESFKYKDGRCDTGPDDAWLAVNIGQAGGGEYFGVVVGVSPGSPEGAKSARGGGEFSGDDYLVTGIHNGGAFLLDEGQLTLDSDLKSGGFSGTSLDGEPMSGSFKC